MKLMVEETQTPGSKRVGVRENKRNLDGGTNERKTKRMILKKIWMGIEVIQNTYVKISHQSDEGAEE